MKSIIEGTIHTQSGYADMVAADRAGSVSQAPFLPWGEIRGGVKFGAFSSENLTQSDGSTDLLLHIPMGGTAEVIAAYGQILRAERD